MKIYKLLLAVCLAVVGFTSVEVKAEDNYIQPYASVINREIDIEREYALHLTNESTQFVKIYLKGTYTHNISGTNEYPTNINLVCKEKYKWSYPLGVEDGTVVGIYQVSVDSVSYTAKDRKLVATVVIKLKSTETSNVGYFTRTITV